MMNKEPRFVRMYLSRRCSPPNRDAARSSAMTVCEVRRILFARCILDRASYPLFHFPMLRLQLGDSQCGKRAVLPRLGLFPFPPITLKLVLLRDLVVRRLFGHALLHLVPVAPCPR